MIDTLNLNEQSIKIDSSVGWLMKYRNQFGHDILPDLIPILDAGFNLVTGIVDSEGELTRDKVFQNLTSEKLTDAIFTLAGFELVTLINITWAMAKQADSSIGTPEEFADALDAFPLDEVLPKLFVMLVKSLSSSKNSKRLQEILEKKTLSVLKES